MNKLISIFFIVFVSINFSYAAQFAVIKSDKAIIYSSTDLDTPIGYTTRGKIIRVGSVPKKRGTIIPILLKGQIGYIKIKNIELGISKDIAKKIKNSNSEILNLGPKTNNFLRFTVEKSSPGESWKNISDKLGDSSSNMTTYGVFAERHLANKQYYFNVGIIYSTISQSKLALRAIGFEGNFTHEIFKYKIFKISANIGAVLHTDVQVEVSGSSEKNKGALYGYKLGGEIQIDPFENILLIANAGLKGLKSSDFKELYLPSENNRENGFSGLSGIYYSVGAAYKF